jgi:RNA polymerase sigma factor (sigma-70 family)
MARNPIHPVLRHLRRVACEHGRADRTDGQLLEAFVQRREEAAFEALVQRHGPMVLGVCHRVLRHAHDAEDAFQATFLVLMRKAAAIAPRERVGNWLYGVAYRTALEARRAAAKRRAREREVPPRPPPEAPPADYGAELHALLDQELSRLPDKYRAPVVLCDLEGKTHHQAARQLGWPAGTLSSRLARARALLARRLAHRGLTLSAGALAVALAPQAVSAFLPVRLAGSTIKAALGAAAGHAAAPGCVSAEVAALTEGVLKAMLLTKVKTVLALGVLVAILGGGVLVGHATWAGAADWNPAGPVRTIADKPAGTSSGRRSRDVERQLQSPLSVRFQEKPLSAILDDLRASQHLNIVVDRPALAEAGLTLDQPITLRLDGVPLKSVLKYVLHDAGLGYTMEDGVLLVTTTGGGGGKLVRRVYPVADLVATVAESSKPPDLVRVITRTVEPQNWGEQGGAGTVEYFHDGRSLVVSQTSAIQEQIQDLLNDLRACKQDQDKMEEHPRD